MVLAGLFRLGRYTRFVALSVMLGFLTRVAVNIILGQLADLTGGSAEGWFALAKAFDLLTHPSRMNLASIAVGVSALLLIVGLARTRVRSFATLFALVLPTVASLSAASVARVNDGGDIPTGLPVPGLPDLGLLIRPSVLTGALAVAVIVWSRVVGFAESAPQPTARCPTRTATSPPRAQATSRRPCSRASPSAARSARRRSAWRPGRAAAGRRSSRIWMIAILVAFSGIVGEVAMPTLAAILIYAAASSFRFNDLRFILRSGRTSQIALISTFAATLVLPVAAAVGIGVALSLLLQLNQEATDLRVVEWVRQPDGRFAEGPGLRAAAARAVGDRPGRVRQPLLRRSTHARARLPDPSRSVRPPVVLRLRGRTQLGATSFAVLADYAERLQAVGGRLLLSGVEPVLLEQLGRAGKVPVEAPVSVFEATAIVGESTEDAYDSAEAWVVGQPARDEPGAPGLSSVPGDGGGAPRT